MDLNNSLPGDAGDWNDVVDAGSPRRGRFTREGEGEQGLDRHGGLQEGVRRDHGGCR